MGLRQRIAHLFARQANTLLDRLEDPRDTLEFAYGEHVAALTRARRGVVEVLTSEKRLEREAGMAHLGTAQREHLGEELAHVRAQRLALEVLTAQLQQRVEQMRIEKLALGARYAAAQAVIAAGEHVTGVSGETAQVAAMVERARATADNAHARAAALLQIAGAGAMFPERQLPRRLAEEAQHSSEA